jgi:hypothetical protein
MGRKLAGSTNSRKKRRDTLLLGPNPAWLGSSIWKQGRSSNAGAYGAGVANPVSRPCGAAGKVVGRT